MKRVALKITSKLRPNCTYSGYALVNELNEQMFSFFSTEKFGLDEELEVHMLFGGHELTYRIHMSHLHEQISSGRIMNALPTPEHPFPARKFYRCFAKVLELNGLDGMIEPAENVTPITAASTTDSAATEPASSDTDATPAAA